MGFYDSENLFPKYSILSGGRVAFTQVAGLIGTESAKLCCPDVLAFSVSFVLQCWSKDDLHVNAMFCFFFLIDNNGHLF